MAEQDPQNIPEQPEDAAPESPDASGAPRPDDIAEAIDRSQRAAESLDADTEADAPPADVSEAADGALKTAEAAVAAAKGEQGGVSSKNGAPNQAPRQVNGDPEAVALPDFNGAGGATATSARDIDLLADVNLNVTIELGRTRMLVEDVLRLGEGSVVELDKLAGDPVDVFVNGRHVARGEVLVVNDNFCVRVSEILSRTPGSDD